MGILRAEDVDWTQYEDLDEGDDPIIDSGVLDMTEDTIPGGDLTGDDDKQDG